MFENEYPLVDVNIFDNDFFFEHYKIRNNPKQKDILKIRKYLFEKEQFFHYEFTLFNNFLTYFNCEFVLLILPTVNKYLDSVNDIVDYQLERIIFYINLGYYFFDKDELIALRELKSSLTKLVGEHYLKMTLEQLYKYRLLMDIIDNNLVIEEYDKLKKLGLEKLLNQVKNKYAS